MTYNIQQNDVHSMSHNKDKRIFFQPSLTTGNIASHDITLMHNCNERPSKPLWAYHSLIGNKLYAFKQPNSNHNDLKKANQTCCFKFYNESIITIHDQLK